MNRHFILEEEKFYSWWSYRNRDWKNSDRGRRLDHILLMESLAHLRFANIFKNARDYENPSDHVPVSIKPDLV